MRNAPGGAPRTQVKSRSAGRAYIIRIYAVSTAGLVYISSDTGVVWKTTTVSANLDGVSCSSTGERLLVWDKNLGIVYISLDFGNTWTPSSLPSKQWVSVVMSGDGLTAYGCYTVNGRIYTLKVGFSSGVVSGIIALEPDVETSLRCIDTVVPQTYKMFTNPGDVYGTLS